MDDKKYNIQNQADQFKMCSIEIDDLQAKVIKTKSGSRAESVGQINELNVKIETARDRLMQIFSSLRSQDNNE
ncbi:MAG: hypothetical protein ACYTBV_19040 [Planctomycetota bacterium]|jgi:hypothetical protein